MLDIFRSLMLKFVSVNYHMNNYGCIEGRMLNSQAIEVTLVNRKLIKVNHQIRSFSLNPLNKANNPNEVDCQMKE